MLGLCECSRTGASSDVARLCTILANCLSGMFHVTSYIWDKDSLRRGVALVCMHALVLHRRGFGASSSVKIGSTRSPHDKWCHKR